MTNEQFIKIEKLLTEIRDSLIIGSPKKRSKGPRFEEDPIVEAEITFHRDKPPEIKEKRSLETQPPLNSDLQAIERELKDQGVILKQIHNQGKGLFEFLRKIFK